MVGGGSARRREVGGGKEARRTGRAGMWMRQVLALQLGFIVMIGYHRYNRALSLHLGSSLQSGRGDHRGRATAEEIAAPWKPLLGLPNCIPTYSYFGAASLISRVHPAEGGSLSSAGTDADVSTSSALALGIFDEVLCGISPTA